MKTTSIIILVLNLFVIFLSAYILIDNKKENDIAIEISIAINNDDKLSVEKTASNNNLNMFIKNNSYLFVIRKGEFKTAFTLLQKMNVQIKENYKKTLNADFLNFDTQEKIRTSDCLEIKEKCVLKIEGIQ